MSGDAPVLDRRRFALLRLPADDPEDDSFAALVRSFAESSAATLDDIRRVAGTADWPGVAALAHRLKGTSALFGALRLRDACDALERATRDGSDPEELRAVLVELAREMVAARDAMERELQQ